MHIMRTRQDFLVFAARSHVNPTAYLLGQLSEHVSPAMHIIDCCTLSISGNMFVCVVVHCQQRIQTVENLLSKEAQRMMPYHDMVPL